MSGGPDDPFKDDPEFQLFHDRLRGAQQGLEPVLRAHHLTGAFHQLVERTVEVGPGHAGDGS